MIAAIDPTQGSLIYYSTEPAAAVDSSGTSTGSPGAAAEHADQPAAPSKDRKEGAAWAAATKARRMMCPKLVSSAPARERLLAVLAEQCVTGVAVAANSAAGWDLAFQFGRSAQLATADVADVETYKTAAVIERDRSQTSAGDVMDLSGGRLRTPCRGWRSRTARWLPFAAPDAVCMWRPVLPVSAARVGVVHPAVSGRPLRA